MDTENKLDPERAPGRLPDRDEPGGWGKVFVAVRYQPECSSRFAECFAGLCEFGLRVSDRRDYEYSKTMHKAANALARKFLESGCDSICFIDADALFGTDALEELRTDPEGWGFDVLQAFTVKRGWPPEPMFLTVQPDQPQSDERLRGLHLVTNLPLGADEIYRVDAVSLHFTLICRAVFEKLLKPEGARYTYWFEYKEDNGEDITFSANARSVGARLGMTTRLKVGHDSMIPTGWYTMVDYYDRQFAIAAGEPPSSLDRFRPYFEAQHQLAELVAEFTGEDAELVYQKACTGVLPVADKWRVDKPETPDEVRAFYGSTPQYFYDLVKWNSTPAFKRLLNRLAGISNARILEFGGGIGTLAEFLSIHGNAVDYYDVPGVLLDFAAWRFTRQKINAPRIVERWDIGEYDWVTAIDVLEHLHPDEFNLLCNGLAWALKPGGRLFAHNNWKQEDGMYPFHFDHSKAWAEFLERHKFLQLDDLTWQKPDDLTRGTTQAAIGNRDYEHDDLASVPIVEF